MRSVNTFVLNFTVSIIDYLYRGRHFQRFWVLEEIARAPYFAFLSVLHFRESLGLRGPEHLYLMKEHCRTNGQRNRTPGIHGVCWWFQSTGSIGSFARHLVIVYYWINVVYYIVGPQICLSPVLRDRDARSGNIC